MTKKLCPCLCSDLRSHLSRVRSDLAGGMLRGGSCVEMPYGAGLRLTGLIEWLFSCLLMVTRDSKEAQQISRQVTQRVR